MKAYVLHDVNDLRFEEVSRPAVGEHMALVKVEAVGICGSDIPRIFYQGAHRMPLIPGHEFSGRVVETGKGVDESWLDRRVGAFPLIPCMQCPQCARKQYEMCGHYNYLGSRTDGGFAEYVAVPEWNLLALPDGVQFVQAAMLEPASVAMHAIRGVQVNAEEKVAVCGLGTIGLLVAMHLKGMGVEQVFVLGNKDAQRKMAAEIGIPEEYFCDTRTADPAKWMLERTNGAGVDVFFECIGKQEIVALGIQATAAGGRVMLVGNPASDMALPREVYWKILRKQLTVKGTWNSSYTHAETDDWHMVLDAIAAGRIRPERLITHQFPLAELYKGMEIMRDKSEDYVKIMGV